MAPTPSLPGPVMDEPTTIARLYAHANSEQADVSYWDYDNVTIKWG